jgi:hypothetical protein
LPFDFDHAVTRNILGSDDQHPSLLRCSKLPARYC